MTGRRSRARAPAFACCRNGTAVEEGEEIFDGEALSVLGAKSRRICRT
jgi:hypothetical protein